MEKKLIPAPIDNKNLMEDAFEDDVFKDFYASVQHRNPYEHSGMVRHLIGNVRMDNEDWYFDSIVDAYWIYGTNKVEIKVIATSPTEDFQEMCRNTLDYYADLFKKWENPDNENLRVQFRRQCNSLFVEFFFEVEE